MATKKRLAAKYNGPTQIRRVIKKGAWAKKGIEGVEKDLDFGHGGSDTYVDISELPEPAQEYFRKSKKFTVSEQEVETEDPTPAGRASGSGNR